MKCVSSSNHINGYCNLWWSSIFFSYSIWVNFISAHDGKFRFDTLSTGSAHGIYEYKDILSSHNHHHHFICGIVLRKITQWNHGLSNHLMGSNKSEKVFPAPAAHHHMTISAGQLSTFSWYHSCGFIIICSGICVIISFVIREVKHYWLLW